MSASTENTAANASAPSSSIDVYAWWRNSVAGEVLGAGQLAIPGLVDHGQVVERDRVGLEREATPLVDLAGGPQVDDRPQRDRAQRLEVIGGQPPEARRA